MAISIKTKTWDKDHTYYADDEQGYYFHTFAQARDYLAKKQIDAITKWNFIVKKGPMMFIHRYTAKGRDWQYAHVKVYYRPNTKQFDIQYKIRNKNYAIKTVKA